MCIFATSTGLSLSRAVQQFDVGAIDPTTERNHGSVVGWAKARSCAPCQPAAAFGGHASLCPPYDASRRRKSALISATQSAAKEHFRASSVEQHRRTSTSSPTWPRCVNGAIFLGIQIIRVLITGRKYYSSATTALVRQQRFRF